MTLLTMSASSETMVEQIQGGRHISHKCRCTWSRVL